MIANTPLPFESDKPKSLSGLGSMSSDLYQALLSRSSMAMRGKLQTPGAETDITGLLENMKCSCCKSDDQVHSGQKDNFILRQQLLPRSAFNPSAQLPKPASGLDTAPVLTPPPGPPQFSKN